VPQKMTLGDCTNYRAHDSTLTQWYVIGIGPDSTDSTLTQLYIASDLGFDSTDSTDSTQTHV